MILHVKNISKSFGNTKVLNNINLEVNEGEILTILGASGSGKSTILNLIAGFEKPDFGEIGIYGDVASSSILFKEPHERNVGFVFQNYALFPHLDVFKNIAFGISYLDVNRQKLQVEKMVKLTGLEGLEKRYPHELSGGQQQRVALARTLATEPKLILFDEAFSNVDSVLKSKIEKELVEIIKDSGISAIFVTHDAKEALSISDKIAYLEEGNIAQLSSPSDMYSNPKSKSVATFFGKANFIQKNGKSLCIRPEECKICDDGEIEATVGRISYKGERYEVEVYFDLDGESYEFILFVDKAYDMYNTNKIRFNLG
jgi:ABC-type Fe3+/spermidine/putrescine transport system ATPase subunit